MRLYLYVLIVIICSALGQEVNIGIVKLDSCSTKTRQLACFDLDDGQGNPMLPIKLEDDPLNTPKSCSARCKAGGYEYAGTVGQVGCRCGHLEPWDAVKASEIDCGMPCPGDERETCGGVDKCQVFFVYPEGCDWMRIVESTEHPSGMYHASNVLYSGCADKDTVHGFGNVTWWQPPDGDNGSFLVELGCSKIVDRVVLRNSMVYGTERATRDFCVSLSAEGQHWTEAVCGYLTMDDENNCTDGYLNNNVTYNFNPMTVKYARFLVKSFYGAGAALEFFDLRGPNDC